MAGLFKFDISTDRRHGHWCWKWKQYLGPMALQKMCESCHFG